MKPEFPCPIEDYVPHAGPMCLLDTLLDASARSLHARVTPHHDSLFAHEQGIPAWVGLEWMAQAVAAWSGIRMMAGNQPPLIGLLLGTRRYDCECAHFPFGQPIEVYIQLDYMSDEGLGLFDCELKNSANTLLASARIKVFEPRDSSVIEDMLDE